MARQARTAHHIPGRLRVVIATARGDLESLVKIAERVRELPGVDWVQTSPQTGSLVIHYDACVRDMEEAVRRLGLRTGVFELIHTGRDHAHRDSPPVT